MDNFSKAESGGAAIRAALGHPVIDSDAHVVECEFALTDALKDVAGSKIANRFSEALRTEAMQRWYHADEPTRRNQRIGRPSFWHIPANTLDRATAMLPALMRKRLDEFGIDFAVVYTTLGLSFVHVADDEMRRALCRAINKLNADTFREHRTRLTPAALIPMRTPQEAMEEIDYAVKTLGMKAITVSGHEWRTLPQLQHEAPALARFTRYTDYLVLDSDHDYDPVWRKCVELGVVPTSHVGTYGGPTHGSISNYTFNHAGHFAAGADMFCRALILGGVPKRFPALKFAFLEGGVGWASMLYNTLIERWEKRNGKEILRSLDPARVDRQKMAALFREYGGSILAPKADAIGKGDGFMLDPPEDRAKIDDFAACGVSTSEELRDQFVNNFYFGCEGEDRMTAVAFNRNFNNMGVQLNALFSSDLGHWDVPEMAEVLHETYELLEHGLLEKDDFRKFVFGNVARMYTSMNPDFFKGTVVEESVAAEIAPHHQSRPPASSNGGTIVAQSRDSEQLQTGVMTTLIGRVSPLRLAKPAPTDSDLDRILAAGVRAPDHGRLRPWRFILIRDDARGLFGTVLAEALKLRKPEANERILEAEREKPQRAPLIIVVTATVRDNTKIPAIEQIVSAGAAAQNMLLAAHALGFGGFWRTGDSAYDAHVKGHLGLKENDTIVGFLYLGRIEAPGPARAANTAGVVEEWTGVPAGSA